MSVERLSRSVSRLAAVAQILYEDALAGFADSEGCQGECRNLRNLGRNCVA